MFVSFAMQVSVTIKTIGASFVAMCAMTLNVTPNLERQNIAMIVRGIANQAIVLINTNNQFPRVSQER